MPFVRITLTHPRSEVKAEVEAHFRDLIATTAKLPGFIAGYVLVSPNLSGEVGRVTFWESHEHANRAANDPHVMAVQAEVKFDDSGEQLDWDLDSPFFIGSGSGATVSSAGS
ncbi:MAG TPA: antibiotic biosynthesis monooxygenase [Dehalococcoidia bacterium]|nr:antibiotic biosynthesis monooxygenase [Dehalococcoidia bacterium]